MVIHNTNMSKKQSHKSGGCGTANDDDRKMRKLFVDKLSAAITEDDIYSVFSKHGEIEEVAKYQDRRAPTRYFAFVVYKKAKDCAKATFNPCPVIRGRQCTCMLAAIGKEFSGYKFFVQEGLLTEEQKQQNAANQGSGSNHQTNSNSNSKHNKKQRQRRHNKNKNKSNNNHNVHHNNNNNNKYDEAQRPRINIPSFKDTEQLSQRSEFVSNLSSFSDTSPIQYVDQPSWHCQYDSHKSQSHSTIISACGPTPTQNTMTMPTFHRESKSLQWNTASYNNGGYNTPQPYAVRQPIPQHNAYANTAAEHRYRSHSMHNPAYIQQQAQPHNYYQATPAMQYYNTYNTARRRTQSHASAGYNSPYSANTAVSFAAIHHLPPRSANRSGYSLSPQPTQPQPSFVVPPMKQSISYSSLERSRSHSSQQHHQPHQPHQPQPNVMKVVTPAPPPMLKRSAGLQQQSAPKLPSFTASNTYLSPPRRVKRTVSNPGLFSGNSEPTYSHSVASTHSHSVHSGMVIMEPEIQAPDLLSPDLLMDLDDNFAEMGIEIGLTPTPPPPPPLPLQNEAKASIDIDALTVPTFKSIEDAKRASDRVLEAGFTMLASPTATASVHTEYNDSDDFDGFILEDYDED